MEGGALRAMNDAFAKLPLRFYHANAAAKLPLRGFLFSARRAPWTSLVPGNVPDFLGISAASEVYAFDVDRRSFDDDGQNGTDLTGR